MDKARRAPPALEKRAEHVACDVGARDGGDGAPFAYDAARRYHEAGTPISRETHDRTEAENPMQNLLKSSLVLALLIKNVDNPGFEAINRTHSSLGCGAT